jgi:2-succinyl-5-enolpyruvyl-6-hydroxy-3-cyclohexene-1-carboxylate synthase
VGRAEAEDHLREEFDGIMNSRLAGESLQFLIECDVKELCVCPGARNAPWIHVLAAQLGQFRAYYFNDERSAAFFAIGRTRATGKPVAVLTTSGTAAGELLPAVMEAHYAGLPLIVMTADRPRRFRGSGAPQAAEQVGIFGGYARQTWDRQAGDDPVEIEWDGKRPLHLNVCFEEPERESSAPIGELSGFSGAMRLVERLPAQGHFKPIQEFFREVSHPMVIVGALLAEERECVAEFLREWGAPAYLEALSGLRERRDLDAIRVSCADRILDRADDAGYRPDGVLRLGGIPTHRLWRDLEEKASHLKVLSVSRLSFSGLGRESGIWEGPLEAAFSEARTLLQPIPASARQLLVQEAERRTGIVKLLQSEPASEPGLFHQLSLRIPPGASVFLGNSLPVREWDLAASWEPRGLEVTATRGLNGIDGQVSTFLGIARPGLENWAIVGDLTALYDLGAPWVLGQLPETQVNLIVINNGGGKIFDRMFRQPEFQNRHSLSFGAWASLWGLSYQRLSAVPDRLESDRSQIIEIVPDDQATRRFWKALEAL